MKCALCTRIVLVTWTLGDGRGVCDGCIRRALKEADRALFAQQGRAVLDRWRRMGFG